MKHPCESISCNVNPTKEPVVNPTLEPDVNPTKEPDVNLTKEPDVNPTKEPDVNPTKEPDVNPTTIIPELQFTQQISGSFHFQNGNFFPKKWKP